MDRRAFVCGATLVVLAVPGPAVAQPARKVARIGIISFAGPASELIGPDRPRSSVGQGGYVIPPALLARADEVID